MISLSLKKKKIMNKCIILLAVMTVAICSCIAAPQGNENHSVTVTVNPSDWKMIGQPGAPSSYASDTIWCPAISQDVFDNGAVLVYVLGTSGGGWYLLPHTYYNAGLTTNFNYRKGYVELRSYNTENKALLPANSFKYKVVILPGGNK
jgi:hypothetical protein